MTHFLYKPPSGTYYQQIHHIFFDKNKNREKGRANKMVLQVEALA